MAAVEKGLDLNEMGVRIRFSPKVFFSLSIEDWEINFMDHI